MVTVQDFHVHSSLHTATWAVQLRLFEGLCCCWVKGLKFDCEFFFLRLLAVSVLCTTCHAIHTCCLLEQSAK